MTDHLVETLAPSLGRRSARRRSSPNCPGRWRRSSSSGTCPSPARRCRGCTRWCLGAPKAASSRTSTATASSTSTPASPSTPPATATPTSSPPSRSRPHSLLHYCSSDFYLPIYGELCERLAALGPVRRRTGARVPRQLRHRGRRGRASSWLATTPAATTSWPSSAGSTAGPSARCRSRPARRTTGPASARCCPGVHHVPYGPAGLDQLQAQAVQAPRGPGGGRGHRRRAGPGRGRLPRPLRPDSWPSCGRSATSTASCSWPTRSRAASAAPGGSGASSTTASSPTSSWRARAWPAACPSARSSPGPTS